MKLKNLIKLVELAQRYNNFGCSSINQLAVELPDDIPPVNVLGRVTPRFYQTNWIFLIDSSFILEKRSRNGYTNIRLFNISGRLLIVVYNIRSGAIPKTEIVYKNLEISDSEVIQILNS